jgi:nucleotide-binding universal stress UspA family protein
MSGPAVRRIVVGIDGSAGSAAALRWACREAGLRGAEVYAVHVREARCHSLASYAVPGALSEDECDDEDQTAQMWQSVLGEPTPGVQVRTEVVEGLAVCVLLDRCEGADMLVLGSAGDAPGAMRSAGPVIRGTLRRAPCPVVVISAAQDPVACSEAAAWPPAAAGAGAGTAANTAAMRHAGVGAGLPATPSALPSGPVPAAAGV